MRKERASNLELLKILCIVSIVSDHFIAQTGGFEFGNVAVGLFYCAGSSMSKVACNIFIIISAWFLVDQPFKLKRIVHTWLTVIMYTVPLTLFCLYSGLASRQDVFISFFPIEESPLWFAGYYIILVLLTPMLNLFLTKAPRRTIEFTVFIMFLLMVLYPTLTIRTGYFYHGIWTMIFLYILTGYIKRYCSTLPTVRLSLSVFALLWTAITVLRAVAQNYADISVMPTIAAYCESYRADIQTFPNLLMAYSLFFVFYGIKVKSSKLINLLASASLGVYCFHQVPGWYTFLWQEVFQSTEYTAMYHGMSRILYTVCCILLVWIIGSAIEIIRSRISNYLIESRGWFNNFCNSVDEMVNDTDSVPLQIRQKKCVKAIAIIFVLYFVVLKIYSTGAFENYLYLRAPDSDQVLVENINFSLAEDVFYESGRVQGVVYVTNNGDDIFRLSAGKYPVNLGAHVVDMEGNVIGPDCLHLPVMNDGTFKSGKTVAVSINLDGVYELEQEGTGLRFEIVQEMVSWVDSTAIYYWR